MMTILGFGNMILMSSSGAFITVMYTVNSDFNEHQWDIANMFAVTRVLSYSKLVYSVLQGEKQLVHEKYVLFIREFLITINNVLIISRVNCT